MIESVARIRIELQDLEPKIWRRVDVPLSSTLAALSDIIQVSFHWQDYHLCEFVVGERVYGVPMDEDEFYDHRVYKAAAIRLKTLVERGVDRFLYVYDFGDNWRHDVSLGRRAAAPGRRPPDGPDDAEPASVGAAPISRAFRRAPHVHYGCAELLQRQGAPDHAIAYDKRRRSPDAECGTACKVDPC